MLMSYPNKVRSLTSSLARQGCSIAVALDVAIFFFFCVCVWSNASPTLYKTEQLHQGSYNPDTSHRYSPRKWDLCSPWLEVEEEAEFRSP